MDILKNISIILDIYLKEIQPIVVNKLYNIFKKYPEIKAIIDNNKQGFKKIINHLKNTNRYTLEEYCYMKKIIFCFLKITSESLAFKTLCSNYIKIIKNLLLIIKHKNKIIERLNNDIYLLKQFNYLSIDDDNDKKNIKLLMHKLKTIDEIDEIEQSENN